MTIKLKRNYFDQAYSTMTKIAYISPDGEIRSSVIILKNGEALEIRRNEKTKWGPEEERRRWSSMTEWTSSLPGEWASVEEWRKTRPSVIEHVVEGAVQPCLRDLTWQLAYFMDSNKASIEEVEDALRSYVNFHKKPWSNPVDNYLATLLYMQPGSSCTIRQMMTALRHHFMPVGHPELTRQNAVAVTADLDNSYLDKSLDVLTIEIPLLSAATLVELCNTAEAPCSATATSLTYFFRSDPRIADKEGGLILHTKKVTQEDLSALAWTNDKPPILDLIPYIPEVIVKELLDQSKQMTAASLRSSGNEYWEEYTAAAVRYLKGKIQAAAKLGTTRFTFNRFLPHDEVFPSGGCLAAAAAPKIAELLKAWIPDINIALELPTFRNGGRITLTADWS